MLKEIGGRAMYCARRSMAAGLVAYISTDPSILKPERRQQVVDLREACAPRSRSRNCSSMRGARIPWSIALPTPTISIPTRRPSPPSSFLSRSSSTYRTRGADSYAPTGCTPLGLAAPLARQVAGGSRSEGTARACACAPRGWSRSPHLVRLAPEGWKRDYPPQPSVRIGPPEEPQPEFSVSATQSRAAWARLIKKVYEADP